MFKKRKAIKSATIFRRPPQYAAGLRNHTTGDLFMFRDFKKKKRELRIGRNEFCEITVPDRRASEIHALIELRRKGVVVIHNTGAVNGLFVDGEALTDPIYLEIGMEVRVGRTVFHSVNEDGLVAVTVHSIGEFCDVIETVYGSWRAVEAHFQGKPGHEWSREFYRNHATQWRHERLFGKPKKAESQ